ncbi:hypothetical protein TH0833_00900 [Helicobacter pylori]
MAYRYDEDLEFLKRLSSNDLKDLFDVLVYDEDGALRMNEELTNSTEYKRYGHDYAKYPERIAEEFVTGAILLLIFLEMKGSYTKRFCAMRAII